MLNMFDGSRRCQGMSEDLKMVDLPPSNEGLSWIVSQGSAKLLLIPGLQPATIVAAAAGDQQALAYLRFRAEVYASGEVTADPGPLQRVCQTAIQIKDTDEYDDFLDELEKGDKQIWTAFNTRQTFTAELLCEAAWEMRLAPVLWLRALCPPTFEMEQAGVMAAAAAVGKLDMLKRLRLNARPAFWNENVSDFAAKHASLDGLVWLLSQDCPCARHVLAVVARHHGEDGLKKIQEVCPVTSALWNEHLTCAAADMGDQHMLQWLRTLTPPVPWNEATCRAAAKHGNIGLLRWLRIQDPPVPWDESVIQVAAANADLTTLCWLRAQRPPAPWDESCIEAAALGRSLSTIQWLRSQDPPCPWGPRTTWVASLCNNLPMLQWLYFRQCPMTPAVLTHAASSGHLAMLQWLHSEGHPMTSDLYYWAANPGKEHIMRWLWSIKLPVPGQVPAEIMYSWVSASIPCLLFLGDIGAPIPEQQLTTLTQARKVFCTFHGLLRWFRRAVSEPIRGMDQAFDDLADDRAGQLLLIQLCLLPPELVNKIAVHANLQHDFC